MSELTMPLFHNCHFREKSEQKKAPKNPVKLLRQRLSHLGDIEAEQKADWDHLQLGN